MADKQQEPVVAPEDVEDAQRAARDHGHAEMLRRLRSAEPVLADAVLTMTVGATEHLRKSGMLDDLEDNLRDKVLLAVLTAVESVRLAHRRRQGRRQGGGEPSSTPSGHVAPSAPPQPPGEA